jgi:hypothetical protein
MEAWEDWRIKAANYRDVGPQVVVDLGHQGTAMDSGIQVTDRDFSVFEVRDGRMTRWLMFDDEADALEAVVLREVGDVAREARTSLASCCAVSCGSRFGARQRSASMLALPLPLRGRRLPAAGSGSDSDPGPPAS